MFLCLSRNSWRRSTQPTFEQRVLRACVHLCWPARQYTSPTLSGTTSPVSSISRLVPAPLGGLEGSLRRIVPPPCALFQSSVARKAQPQRMHKLASRTSRQAVFVADLCRCRARVWRLVRVFCSSSLLNVSVPLSNRKIG